MLIQKTFKVKGKDVTLCEWTNREDLLCLNKAYAMVQRNDPNRQELVLSQKEVWNVAMAVFKGEASFKGKTLEETYNKIQDLPYGEATELGNGFMQLLEELGVLKKKSSQQSGPSK